MAKHCTLRTLNKCINAAVVILKFVHVKFLPQENGINSVLYVNTLLRHLGPLLRNKLEKKTSLKRAAYLGLSFILDLLKDLTELINGNNCSRMRYLYLLTCARVRKIALMISVYFSIL